MAATDVLIVCEVGEGQSDSANTVLVANGRALARHLGGRLVCLLAGHGIGGRATELGRYADEVQVCDSPLFEHYAPHVLLELVHERLKALQPTALLMAHTFMGLDLAPRLAARLGVGSASNCLRVQIANDTVRFVRPMYRNRMHAEVLLEGRPMIATLQPGTAEWPAPVGVVVAPLAVPAPQAVDRRMRAIGTLPPPTKGVDITRAAVVVCGGRGIGERENYALVSELAKALGGVAACSRPLVDMGWLSSDFQVGLSGNTVKPKLYVACGVSGAIEHLHGMKESGFIVAINKDSEAPIFKVAHCGVAADLHQVLPRLTEAVCAARAAADLRTL